ncbi:MAG TPA: 4Fe-4S binding protein [Paludibacteraceae bacterium]|nr:4Fe-4S binding protein [Paludibacteraceae bacterium]
MLKKFRIGISVTLFVLINLFFLDFAGFLPLGFHSVTKIQLVPALLALNVEVLVILLVLSLVFGRVYCSFICPMGVYQDVVAWLSKKFTKKKKYTFSKAMTVLRWTVLAATVIAFIFGFNFLVGLLDPYGAYGRIVTHIFRPAYLAGNNLLEYIFSSFDNYTFYKVGIYSLGLLSTLIALATLVGIGLLAWRNGRTWCNTICPVGTLLGFISRYSLFRLQFDDDKCNSCGLCAMKCKASCINSKDKQIDYSRCVTCFNCIEACNRSAMKYAPYKWKKTVTNVPENKTVDESKRRFLSATVVTAVAATSLMGQKVASFTGKRALKRNLPIVPPGGLNVENLQEKCISCHLCVSKCPSHVIKPAFTEYGLGGMMQPRLYFDHGFCNYDCTVCSDVCPSKALRPLTVEQKHQTQVGQVHFIRHNCIVFTDETNCGACSEHCPTQAVHMVPYKGVLTIPETDVSICVGCGGCEYVCPAKPYKAIYVEGLEAHNTLQFKKEKKEDIKVDDFGF